MNYEELLKRLDLEGPEDFQYFENMADLLESEESVDREAFYRLLSQIDKKLIAELIESYFEDACESVPESAIELFTLLNTIKLSLTGMARESERDESRLVLLTDELLRFRKWYIEEKRAVCTNREDKRVLNVPVAEALILSRLEKIGGDDYDYDFDDALEYPLDEYAVSFADMIALDEDDDGFTL